MIVDQADDLAAHTQSSRRTAKADHLLWQDASPPVATAVPDTGNPVAKPGLRGFWPVPHSGTPTTARRVLRADTASPKEARDFTVATLADWDLGDHADDAVMAVSELVTNALRHGLGGQPAGMPRRPVQLVLLGHPRRLIVVVTDPGELVPEPVAHSPEWFGEGGRGLLVVGAVSSAWGWAPLTTGGKAVWATFDLPRPQAA